MYTIKLHSKAPVQTNISHRFRTDQEVAAVDAEEAGSQACQVSVGHAGSLLITQGSANAHSHIIPQADSRLHCAQLGSSLEGSGGGGGGVATGAGNAFGSRGLRSRGLCTVRQPGRASIAGPGSAGAGAGAGSAMGG